MAFVALALYFFSQEEVQVLHGTWKSVTEPPPVLRH